MADEAAAERSVNPMADEDTRNFVPHSGMIRTGMNPVGTVAPETVAANVVDAIQRNRAYVYTDDHDRDAVEHRLRALIQARDDVLPA